MLGSGGGGSGGGGGHAGGGRDGGGGMSGDGEGDIGGGMASGRSTRRSAKAPMAVMAHRVEVSMINRYTNDAHVSTSQCCCAGGVGARSRALGSSSISSDVATRTRRIPFCLCDDEEDGGEGGGDNGAARFHLVSESPPKVIIDDGCGTIIARLDEQEGCGSISSSCVGTR